MAREKRPDAKGADARQKRGPERRVKRDRRTSELLERGEGPADPVGSFEGSPSEFTTEGGRGTNTPDRQGGPMRRERQPPDERTGNTGGEGGVATLGGGVYYGEGSYHDAPNYGDWTRHGGGATSGARGRGGLDFPGERTWGESQRAAEQRQVTGRHAGRGPRAYRRADESIREEVCALLTENPDLDASDVEVRVEGGEVTLIGSVDSRDAKWLAEDLAESISGVREVHNRLRVARR